MSHVACRSEKEKSQAKEELVSFNTFLAFHVLVIVLVSQLENKRENTKIREKERIIRRKRWVLGWLWLVGSLQL